MNLPLDREALITAPNPLGLAGIEFVEYSTPRPQALGQVLEQMGVVAGLRFEGKHGTGRPHQLRREHREVPDVRPDVDEGVARLENRTDEVRRFRLVEATGREVVEHEALAHVRRVEQEAQLARSVAGVEGDAQYLAHVFL